MGSFSVGTEIGILKERPLVIFGGEIVSGYFLTVSVSKTENLTYANVHYYVYTEAC